MTSMDMHTKIDTSSGLNIQSIASDTTTNGIVIDTQNFESIEWLIFSGTITDGTYTPVIEESDAANFSGATTVSTDFLLGTIANATFAAADDNTVKRIGSVGKKRYQRLSITSAGTSSGGTLGAIRVLGNARHQPTSGS